MKNVMTNNQIIDLSYDILSENKKSFAGFSSLMMLIVGIAMNVMISIVQIILIIFILIFAEGVASSTFDGGSMMIIYIITMITTVPIMSLVNLISAGPVRAVEAYRNGEKISFSMMFGYSFKKILYIITSSIAENICVFGILGIIIFLLYGINGMFEDVLFLQVIFFIIFGVAGAIVYFWFMIRTMFYLPIALYEKKHFFGAVVQSFRMTTGRTYPLFKLMLTYVLSISVIYISTQGLMALASALIGAYFAQEASAQVAVLLFLLMELVFVVLQFIGSIFLLPLVYLPIPAAYFSERNVKYGDDLFLRIDSMTKKLERERSLNGNADI